MNANFVSSFLHLDLNDDAWKMISSVKSLRRSTVERLSKDVFVLKEALSACKNKLVFVC